MATSLTCVFSIFRVHHISNKTPIIYLSVNQFYQYIHVVFQKRCYIRHINFITKNTKQLRNRLYERNGLMLLAGSSKVFIVRNNNHR